MSTILDAVTTILAFGPNHQGGVKGAISHAKDFVARARRGEVLTDATPDEIDEAGRFVSDIKI